MQQGLYAVGGFRGVWPTGFAEWNGPRFEMIYAALLGGEPGMVGTLAARLLGSPGHISPTGH